MPKLELRDIRLHADTALPGHSGPQARIDIDSDGVQWPSAVQVVSQETWHQADGTATATLRIAAAGGGAEGVSFPSEARLGAPLRVGIGYGGEPDVVFAGAIQGLRWLCEQSGAPVLEVGAASAGAPIAERADVAVSAVYGATVLSLDAWLDVGDAASGTDAGTLQGQLVMPGNVQAEVGAGLVLQGVAPEFDRPLRITAIGHAVSSGGWTTRVAFRSWPA